jgi:hypothetical protein
MNFRRLLMACCRCAGIAVLLISSDGALAQGGPPLVTDDPETPGDGHWETNIAAIGMRTPGRWDIDAPDADINYGLGENIQLKLDIPWAYSKEPNQAWRSGAGTAQVGVKWRFADIQDSGLSMSTYPQLSWNLLSSSVSRGITTPGRQFFLPIEAATVVGDFRLDGEIGRNFVQQEQNQWMVGAVLAHSCGGTVECVGEVHETLAPHNSQTLLNLGIHWKLSESVILLASAGRELGRPPMTSSVCVFTSAFSC